ncbi:Modification methylase BanI [uncultured Ruminococcus sp.]|nr:Modification methylase BanI [uncultured Ruminococcus sp.]
MKFIDFFAGIGGFRRGMELAGHECVGFCEFDKFATASYISMHLLTEEQRKVLENIPIKKRQKEILKEEYRNGEWYANDIRRVYAGDIPKADCWCFGFPCFAKGTYILTEKGYIPIEDVSVGDKVLTHKGRWRKVTATMHRDGARLWDVNGFGILPTRTTAEHPYYVTKPDQPMEFKKVEQLDDSWYSTMVLPDAESDGYSKEMWWIIGRYLADGWRVERKDRPSGGRIVFAISDDKRTEFEQRLREAKLHGTYTKERTCGKYHVCNNQLYEYLEKFGKYAHGKRIPREALCLPREKAKYFFDGYMSGDGRSDREEATSTSAALILGMCIIAQRLGKSVPAVYYTRRDEKCVIQGRECRQRDTYTFRISSKSVKGHYRARYVCRELYQPTESDDFGTVYNISVEEDNSYVANGAIVHNCQDISVAGKQAGFQGNRSSLFFRVMYLVGQLKEEDKPAYLFIENVKNLLSVNGGWDFARLLIEMEQWGYDAEWQVLNSKDFGVPQNRERCFIIGHLRGRSTSKIFPIEGTDGKNSVSLKLFGCINGRNSQRERVYDSGGLSPTINTVPGGNTEPKIAIPVLTPDRAEKRQNGRRFKEDGEPMFTLTSQDRHGVATSIPVSMSRNVIENEINVAHCLNTNDSRKFFGKNQKGNAVIECVADKSDVTVKVAEATKQGYSECRVGIDTVNLSVTGSKTRRGRVGKEIANTLDTSCNQGIFVQVSEELVVYAVWYEKYQCYIAIRKLTPKECFRLQGWSDDYFKKAQFVNSDSQLYKQAGNGVTVTVIETIARKMNVNLN